MELCREHFGSGKVTFLIISDDIQWCKKHLYKKKVKDVYFVSKDISDTTKIDWSLLEDNDAKKMALIDSTGHDLAVMSMSNHTILSRGSFSYYSSIFAGSGVKILPCHFQAYQDLKVNVHHICYRNPFTKPLTRFYPISH